MNKSAEHSSSHSHFSIKAVAQATGLTVETLRAWERRYEVVQPNRDGSGRRTYSATDVARLRLLRTATELGHTISRLAQLSDEDLAKLVNDSGASKESTHVADAKAGAQAFIRSLPNPPLANAICSASNVYSLVGAALLRTEWCSELSILSEPCLVLKASADAG